MQQFDVEGYLAQKVNWEDKIEKEFDDPPIILRGFCRRQDGIGSHLPNLYDNVFNKYKNVSLQVPTDRRPFQHGFLQDITDTSQDNLDKFHKDFEWINKFRFFENRHIQDMKTYRKPKVIHVSGFCGSLEREYQENFLDFYKYKKQYDAELYLYLMWESRGYQDLEGMFEIYDNVIVTNSWLYKELKAYFGDKIKLHQVEHVAHYYTKAATGSSDKFTYGFSGGLWERKKVDVVMEAFHDIKQKDDILKLHTRRHANTEQMLYKFDEDYKKYQGQISFTNKTMPDAEFVEWWDSLNCYVFISAGESYSVTPRQALMQGTPVILSKNTSHLDLLDVPGILWVNCTEADTAKYSGNADLGSEIGAQFEPHIDEVKKCMKEVKKNYIYWKAEAQKGGEIIKQRTSKENIAKQWRNVLCK